MKAIWNDTILAESENTVVVEGNHYFPPDSFKLYFFNPSSKHSSCASKGEGFYYLIEVNG